MFAIGNDVIVVSDVRVPEGTRGIVRCITTYAHGTTIGIEFINPNSNCIEWIWLHPDNITLAD